MDWPELAFDDWKETCTTLQLWTQVVGKIRLSCAPHVNHWWQVPLYVTARGLTTSPMPYGGTVFQIDFDFCAHHLLISVSDGRTDSFPLAPMSVAEFYQETMARLRRFGIEIAIWPMPVEIADPISFAEDRVHAAYDAQMAQRFWRVLVLAERAMTEFRGRFIGKVSPVHFFWGSFDLAVTRFSGRRATPHPGAPNIALSVVHEAYSHEVSSCGFWPGNGGFGKAAFYSYAYPEPPGFTEAKISPHGAYYSRDLGEFILPYDSARQAEAPEEAILQFLQSTYDAAADLAGWDRAALERNAFASHP